MAKGVHAHNGGWIAFTMNSNKACINADIIIITLYNIPNEQRRKVR